MTAKIKLNAASGGGSVSLQAPTSTTSNANVEFKLPVADGTSGQALTTNASGQLAFATVAVGGASNIAFNNGNGIDFSATGDAGGMSSELFHDYEEGTFTPSWNAGGGVTYSHNHQYGFYTRIGDTVTFQVYLMGHASSISGGNSGNAVSIQGLPFTILNHARYYPAFTIGRTYFLNIGSDKRLYAYGDSDSTNIRLILEQDDTGGDVLTAVMTDHNPCLIQVGGHYRV